MSPTDHDRVVSVEGIVGTLCADVSEIKGDVKRLNDFMVEVRSTTSLVRWQIATMVIGFGSLAALILSLH